MFLAEFGRCAACPALEGPVKGTQLGEAEEEADLTDGHLVARQVARGQITAKRIEELPVRRTFGREESVETPDAHLETRGEPHSCRLSTAQLVTEDASDSIGDAVRARRLFEPLRSVPIEDRDERGVRANARRLQQGSREDEGVLPDREVHARPEETGMLAGIRRGRVRKVDFLRRPIHASRRGRRDPRRQQEFCGLARHRRAASKLVAKHRPLISDLQLDALVSWIRRW